MTSYVVVLAKVDGHVERVLTEGQRAPVAVVDSGGFFRFENLIAGSERDAVEMAKAKRLELMNRGRAPHTMVRE